jgi:hypothetical protein
MQVLRTCSKQGGPINACTTYNSHLRNCQICDTDLCNGSSRIHIGTWSLIAVSAAFMKFF